MDIKIFYLSLRNRAALEKLILTNAKKEKILHKEKLLEKYTNEQFKNMYMSIEKCTFFPI